MTNASTRVTAHHLSRNAYLYVRQSTLRQVVENGESTQRQYNLAERAVAHGWRQEQVITIDCDLGQSAAGTADRQGFQELVKEVGLGHAGIVLGLEVSRLARNSSDWHRLLEICALSSTLILDEDGVYDPSCFNDRLLLGLKGTMSEAELHVLRARLRGGILNKAKRGELCQKLPIGYVRDGASKVVFDPDGEIRERVQHLFETFARLGSAAATAKEFQRARLDFPARLNRRGGLEELVWNPLTAIRTLQILHNPIYSGAYVYGRYGEQPGPNGKKRRVVLPRSEWLVTLPGSHPGYITWDEYLRNQETIRKNGLAYGVDRRTLTPREGPALLQGILLCGKCGQRMWVQYDGRKEEKVPIYECRSAHSQGASEVCQRMHGKAIDEAMGQLLLGELTSEAIELCLAVQEQVRERAGDDDRQLKLRVQRAEYEANLSRSRYLQVDPSNRLVADSLEADWNEKLRALRVAQEDRKQGASKSPRRIETEQRAELLGLPDGFAALWADPSTAHQTKKRLVRLLVDDVTLVRGEDILVQVRLKGGSERSFRLPVPLCAFELRRTPAEVVRLVDELLGSHTRRGVVAELRARGIRTGAGDEFTSESVEHLIQAYGLKPYRVRLVDQGMLSRAEVAARLGVSVSTAQDLHRSGQLTGIVADDKGTWMYDAGEVDRLKEARREAKNAPKAPTVRSRTSAAV